MDDVRHRKPTLTMPAARPPSDRTIIGALLAIFSNDLFMLVGT